MSTHISVNNKTTVHKKSSGKAISFPDVCKTPSPGGPVPIPYGNLAQSTDSGKTTKKVKVQKKGANQNTSVFTTSVGDEAGTAGGGVISSKTKGKAKWKNASHNVKFEKKKVARMGDPMGTNASATENGATMEAQPPKPVMGKAGDPDACDKLKDKQVPDDKVGEEAEKNGMLAEHAKGMQNACKENENSATVRKSNTAAMDKIRAGHPAKGCDVANKSIDLNKRPQNAKTRKKIEKNGLSGFVGVYDEKGNVTGVLTKQKVEKDGKTVYENVPHSLDKIPPVPKETYTGDYDLHDCFGKDGKRIKPGAQEDKLTRSMNKHIARGTAGDESTDMVRHGPQANFYEYRKESGKLPIKKEELSLLGPDVSKEEPLLHFDQDGNVYKIESEEELRLLYACKGTDPPESWDWDADQWNDALDKGEVEAVPDWAKREPKPAPKPTYENPGHHDPSGGPNPYNPKKSVLPSNHQELWDKSVPDPKKAGTRWASEGKGKSATHHRFQDGKDGKSPFHWNGSTAGKSKSGKPVEISKNNVPNSIKKGSKK